MTSKTDKSIGLASGLLLGVAAAALMALPASVRAQGWTAELSDIAKTPPPAGQRRGKPTAAAKTKVRPETAKPDAHKAAKADPAKAEHEKAQAAKLAPAAVPIAVGAEASTAEPAPALVPAPAALPEEPEKTGQASPQPAEPATTGAQPEIADNIPADAARAENDIADAEAEPDDPFADLKIIPRSADSDTLTTQVLPGESKAPTEPAPPAERGPASQYCTNIADAAIDARIAWQRQNLAEAEKEVQRRTTELEAKTAEYQRWLARRDQFAEKAQKAVVDIYSKMKPDAAASQLQALDDETAAAVLIKLDARVASSVMNEMEPVQAARLTSILSLAAKGPGQGPRPRQAPPAGNRS